MPVTCLCLVLVFQKDQIFWIFLEKISIRVSDASEPLGLLRKKSRPLGARPCIANKLSDCVARSFGDQELFEKVLPGTL